MKRDIRASVRGEGARKGRRRGPDHQTKRDELHLCSFGTTQRVSEEVEVCTCNGDGILV
jgi:hypothetical protein